MQPCEDCVRKCVISVRGQELLTLVCPKVHNNICAKRNSLEQLVFVNISLKINCTQNLQMSKIMDSPDIYCIFKWILHI